MLISCHFWDCKALLSNGKKCYSKCWPLSFFTFTVVKHVRLFRVTFKQLIGPCLSAAGRPKRWIRWHLCSAASLRRLDCYISAWPRGKDCLLWFMTGMSQRIIGLPTYRKASLIPSARVCLLATDNPLCLSSKQQVKQLLSGPRSASPK